jgi:hypothetical protein
VTDGSRLLRETLETDNENGIVGTIVTVGTRLLPETLETKDENGIIGTIVTVGTRLLRETLETKDENGTVVTVGMRLLPELVGHCNDATTPIGTVVTLVVVFL